MMINWWWIVFVESMINKKDLVLFPVEIIFRDPHLLKSLTGHKQDLNLHRTWIWDFNERSCTIVITTIPQCCNCNRRHTKTNSSQLKMCKIKMMKSMPLNEANEINVTSFKCHFIFCFRASWNIMDQHWLLWREKTVLL